MYIITTNFTTIQTLIKFSNQYFVLHQQINIVNDYIDDTNRILQVYTPCLSDDLLKSKRNSPFSTHTKYKYKFTAYSDGGHLKKFLFLVMAAILDTGRR